MPSPALVISLFVLLCVSPCWAHPGSLGEYPERFPGKTLQAIADEWEPRAGGALSEFELLNTTRDLADDWSKVPVDELKRRIQTLLDQNRRGDYRKRIANGLNDLIDLLSNGDAGRSDEAADYVAWRMNHLEADDGFFDAAPTGHWDETKQQAGERTRQWETERNQEVADISIKADIAAALLRPHWLVQCGALEFRHGRHQQATSYFQRVCEAFPQHPRAEVALLMLARVRLEEWKHFRMAVEYDARQGQKLLDDTRRAFDLYRTRYPEGRFVADVVGWEAGIQRLNGQLSGALQAFLLQARQPDHPEIRRRAFQQIEWLLRDLAERPGDFETLPWQEIAAEPVVALRMGYFMLDAESERDLGAMMFRRSGRDHRVLKSLAPTLAAVRTAARPAWSWLDKALAKQPLAYRGKQAVLRDVLHAWSAIMRGEPTLALAMVDAQATDSGADDALFVRAIARVKAGQPAEAIRAFDDLDQRCPDSTLRRGGDVRRSDAWVHLQQAAAAIPLLWDMLERKDLANYKAAIEERPALHLPGEIEQRLSAVLTFGPMNQLVQAAGRDGLPAGLRTILRSTLRIRHLGEEQFAESLRYAEDADFESWDAAHRRWDESAQQQAVAWRESLAALQQLTAAVERASTGEAKAAAWMDLGKAWEQRLWRLLDGGSVPVNQGNTFASLPVPSFELRHHALHLGLNDAAAAAQLDQRQEMTHAIRCYEQALKLSAKGSANGLAAMLAIHAALRTRAEFSPYFMDRAVEASDAAWSKTLHDRIKAEHPSSDASRSIVWWTFHPSSTLGEWRPGGSALFGREVELAARLTSDPRPGYWEDHWRMEQALKALTARLKQAFANEQDSAKLRGEITAIRRTTRREAPTAKASVLLNHLDDLDLLLSVPDLSADARNAYFQARMDGKPIHADDAMFGPIKDFVAFWNAVITPSATALTDAEIKLAAAQPDRSARQRIAQAQVARMTGFIAQFPSNPKREAALARLAINTLRQSRCHCGMASVDAVGTASTAYATFRIERGLSFDAQAVTAALDRYDREFPSGRYQWDLRLIRGIAASESKDWAAAMPHLIAILGNPDQRDLHLDASNNLCAIFMQLLEPDHRTAIMQAIKATPGAWDKLEGFMQSPTCGWQLRILQDWLLTARE